MTEQERQEEVIHHLRDCIDEVQQAQDTGSNELLRLANRTFSGLAIAMQALAGREFQAGYTGYCWYLVEIVQGKEILVYMPKRK
jgi:hypothetical protein